MVIYDVNVNADYTGGLGLGRMAIWSNGHLVEWPFGRMAIWSNGHLVELALTRLLWATCTRFV